MRADVLMPYASELTTIGTALLMVIMGSLYIGLMIRGLAGAFSRD